MRPALWFLCATAAIAQQNDSNSGSNQPPPPKPPPVRAATSVPSTPRADSVTGRVLIYDGSPPGDSVGIDLVCGGAPQRVGSTLPNGVFTVRTGGRQSLRAPDQASQTTREESDNTFCEIRASLPGYRSSSAAIDHRTAASLDIGELILYPLQRGQSATISVVSARAPAKARRAYDKSRAALARGNPDVAQRELLRAVAIYPDFADAWYGLGRVYEQRDHYAQASAAYLRAVDADPRLGAAYERLYLLAVREKNWTEVVNQTGRLLRLDPYEFGAAYYFRASALLQLRRFAEAESSARQGAELTGRRQQPWAKYMLAVILNRKGDLAGASQAARDFLRIAPRGREREQAQQMLADLP